MESHTHRHASYIQSVMDKLCCGQNRLGLLVACVGFVLIAGMLYPPQKHHLVFKPPRPASTAPYPGIMDTTRFNYNYRATSVVIDRSKERPSVVWNQSRMFAEAWEHVTASWNPDLGIEGSLTHPDPHYSAPCWRERITTDIVDNAYRDNRYLNRTHFVINRRSVKAVSILLKHYIR